MTGPWASDVRLVEQLPCPWLFYRAYVQAHQRPAFFFAAALAAFPVRFSNSFRKLRLSSEQWDLLGTTGIGRRPRVDPV